jgi:hypothetical protein
MPNPPKPLEQKRLTGNPGKRALPKDGAIVVIAQVDNPQPLRPLQDAGFAFWDEAWGKGQLWLGRTDKWLVQLTAEMFDEREELRGIVADRTASGDKDAWRDRRQLRDLERSIVANLSLLAWTPVDRSRYGLAEVKAKSKLAEFMEKHGNS